MAREIALDSAKAALAGHGPGDGDGHLFQKSDYIRGYLPRVAVERLVTLFGAERESGETRELDLTPWGGAYNRIPTDGIAFPHRGERFLLKHAVTVKPPSPHWPTPSGWLDSSWQAVHRYGSGGVYPNFPDPTLTDPERAYWCSNLQRLRRTKGTFDPDQILPGATPPETEDPA